MNTFAGRMESLRAMMRSRGWDAVVFTGSDPHGSEYPAERYKQIRWLTGFTGEAARVVVTAEHAGLWTDSRYFIQAASQLRDTGVELHREGVPGEPSAVQWLASRFADSCEPVLAFDGECTSADFVAQVEAAFAAESSRMRTGGPTTDPAEAAFVPESAPITVSVPGLIGALWTDRPGIPQTPVFTVDSGESRLSRIGMLRRFCASEGADGILLTALDEIAWTLNVRASDIEYNPFVISYLLVTGDSASWFVLKGVIEDPDTERTMEELASDGVQAEAYEDLESSLASLGGMKLLSDTSNLSMQLGRAMEAAGVVLLPAQSPVKMAKAVKNPCEIEGMRQAHIRDGEAMVRFLYWLEKSLRADRCISEWDAAVKLGELRSRQEGCFGDSFETISAFGSGAALPHYSTPHSGAPMLEPRGLYLCDSGGQYIDGTTDITRTVPLGDCTALEAEDYTLVLKGHIDLAMAIFPEGTPGCRIDALAREPLWRFRRNFGHGTGHGVGCFLGVHEGPQDIRQNLNAVPLKAGMVLSDEPGIYREGMHGVRHENLLLCVEAGENEFGRWLGFEPLTLCPFDTSVLMTELLDRAETEWLDAYHERVYSVLSPLLEEDIALWLRNKCRKITTFAE